MKYRIAPQTLLFILLCSFTLCATAQELDCSEAADSIISQTLGDGDSTYLQTEILEARKVGNQKLAACISIHLEKKCSPISRFDLMLNRIQNTANFNKSLCYEQLLVATEYLNNELTNVSSLEQKWARLKLEHCKAKIKEKESQFDECLASCKKILSELEPGENPKLRMNALLTSALAKRLVEAYKPFEQRNVLPAVVYLDSVKAIAKRYDTTYFAKEAYHRAFVMMLLRKADYPAKYEDAADLLVQSYRGHTQEKNYYMAHGCLNGLLEVISRSRNEKVRQKIFDATEFTNLEDLVNASIVLARKLNLNHTFYNTYFNTHTAYWSVGEDKKALAVVPDMLRYSNLMYGDKQARAQQEFETKFKLMENEAKLEKLNTQSKNQRRNTIIYVLFSLILFSVLAAYWMASKKNNKIITEQNNELKELDQQKNKLFANLSHELRTPLTLVRGPLEQLHSSENLAHKNQDLVKLGLKNTIKLEERVNEILDLAKLEKGKLKLSLSSTSMVKFINRVVYSFESYAHQEGVSIELKTRIPSDDKLAIDRVKVEKVVNNLMSNAIKNTGKDGRIAIDLAKNEAFYLLTVADTGPGIAPFELDKIFDRFYQSSTGKAEGGTGIGLSLSRQLARLMGGDVVARNSEGSGAIFTFTFMAHNTSDHESPYTDELVLESSGDNYAADIEFGVRPKVLVVEDNDDMREYISSTLQTNFLIHKAANGVAAWEVLENESIDMIISDIMMPQKDGFELLKEVKGNENFKNIPLIILSARTDEEDKIFAFENGVDDYIVKPFLHKELLARMSSLLRNLEVRKEANNSDSPSQPADEQALQKIKDSIRANIERKYSVDDLADDVNMSERSLYRLLRSKIGVSPAAYIKELKLAHAYELLRSKNYTTVKEVSYAIGFGRPDYFASEFAKRYGRNPSSYC